MLIKQKLPNENTLKFQWEGTEYRVCSEAVEMAGIVLPNGKFLAFVENWEPPAIPNLASVTHDWVGSPPKTIANVLNAALAVRA